MKYSSELIIDLPRERVIEYFDSFENLKKWQPGLQLIEPISGEPGEPGAKTRLVYNEGGRRIDMIETITVRNLPDEFSATYEAKGVMNGSQNRFYEESPEKTRWVMENEFQFSGLMRIMALFMRGAFPKQTLESMEKFKEYAEGEAAS